MNSSKIKTNMSSVSKICLSALFIALATIFQKVIGINYYIVPIPFLRISLGGPAIIIFSSIFLGPVYGMFVGFASDLLGYLIFDPKSISFLPQITLIYTVLGFISYFIFNLVRFVKNKKVSLTFEIVFLIVAISLVSIFLFSRDEINIGSSVILIVLWQKILMISILAILAILMVIFIIIFSKKMEQKTIKSPLNSYQISFALLLIELLVMVIFGTIMKGWAFGFHLYPVILVCQIIILFFNVPINTVLITIFMNLFKNKYISRKD